MNPEPPRRSSDVSVTTTADPSRSLSHSTGFKVYPHVFVGDLTCALDLKQLAERNITHIVTATNKMKPMHGKALHYLVLDFPDSADQNILDTFAEAHKFIDEAVSGGGKVLVHCMMGQSRSVSVVTSYMMRKDCITEAEALRRIREQRPNAKPIEAFLKQLQLFHALGYEVDEDHPAVQELRKSTKAVPRTKSSPMMMAK